MSLLDKIKNYFTRSEYTAKIVDGVLHIESKLPVSVETCDQLTVKDSVKNIEVFSSTNINVYGNASINTTENFYITSGKDILIKSGGRFAIDSNRIDLNSGVADHLSLLSSSKSSNMLEFDD